MLPLKSMSTVFRFRQLSNNSPNCGLPLPWITTVSTPGTAPEDGAYLESSLLNTSTPLVATRFGTTNTFKPTSCGKIITFPLGIVTEQSSFSSSRVPSIIPSSVALSPSTSRVLTNAMFHLHHVQKPKTNGELFDVALTEPALIELPLSPISPKLVAETALLNLHLDSAPLELRLILALAPLNSPE